MIKLILITALFLGIAFSVLYYILCIHSGRISREEERNDQHSEVR